MGIRKLNKKGDTIVEVLIAVVIVGLTIAIAYAIATRSLRAAQQSQERSEAVKIAEQQIESMKSIAAKDTPVENAKLFNNASTFCITDDLSKVNVGSVPTLEQDNLDSYPAGCVRNPDNRYHVAIRRTGLSSGRYQFSVSVRWFKLGSNQKEEVKIEYRLHPL